MPYDQLTDEAGPLAENDPGELGIVVVESSGKATSRPYHKQKLALVVANMRHFCLEQAARGVAVRHVVAAGPYREALEPEARALGGLTVMEPAERELRQDLAPLVDDGLLEVVEHAGWLTTREQFEDQDGPPWRMDVFYRRVRNDTGLLMEEGGPAGGKYSFDPENRERWDGEPAAPEPPRFAPDNVTCEVGDLVAERFGDHPGELDLELLPATRDDARRQWRWALEECLPRFGPYEDAMSTRSEGLFHTRVAPLLNLHRLLPRRAVDDVAGLDIPLQSKEGFVRQVVGWREFVRHVHRATDGFRTLDAAASPSYLGAEEPLPAAYWGVESGLHCLDHVVGEVWRTAYGHHITRLMVLSNIATLLDVSPRELTDWFWIAYADAYDWVVEPNVLGMGTFAAGDLMTTKPYVSGANYIHKMSDYCGECAFDPKKNCPLTSLYWAFLARHRERLEDNRRLALPLASLAKRSKEKRENDRRVFEVARQRLAGGELLRPEDFEE